MRICGQLRRRLWQPRTRAQQRHFFATNYRHKSAGRCDGNRARKLGFCNGWIREDDNRKRPTATIAGCFRYVGLLALSGRIGRFILGNGFNLGYDCEIQPRGAEFSRLRQYARVSAGMGLRDRPEHSRNRGKQWCRNRDRQPLIRKALRPCETFARAGGI